MPLTKGYHCAYDTHYHVVCPVKYRKALLDEAVVGIITQTAKEIEERYDIAFEQMGADRDHIHLLLSFHPKYSGGGVVRIFKSITARELFRQLPRLKKELWGGEFWSDGYYLSTVGQRGSWDVVVRYIKQQGKTPDTVQLRMW